MFTAQWVLHGIRGCSQVLRNAMGGMGVYIRINAL